MVPNDRPPDEKSSQDTKLGSHRNRCYSYVCIHVHRQITLACDIGVPEMVSKLFLYYLHERLWQRASWRSNRSQKVEYRTVCGTLKEGSEEQLVAD